MSLGFLRHPLARDITIVLAVKLVLIVLAGIFLFGADQRVAVDAGAEARHLFNSPSL